MVFGLSARRVLSAVGALGVLKPPCLERISFYDGFRSIGLFKRMEEKPFAREAKDDDTARAVDAGLLSASTTTWAKFQWLLCGGATLVTIGLHVLHLYHAGGMWRDEASSIGLATVPSWGDLWRMIGHDSSPILFYSLVRCWFDLGLGSSDFGLRGLGLLVGLLVVASLWINGRVFRLGAPSVSLGLLVVNSTLLCWGDSVRAYGLGCFFITLTIGAVWSMVLMPGPGRFVLASLAAILSVQTLYQNAFLLLAICAAGFLVCLCHKKLGTGLRVLAIGAPAALSLLPYLNTIQHSQEWFVVSKIGFHPNIVFSNLFKALGSPLGWVAYIWMGLGGLAVAGGVVSLLKNRKSAQPGMEDRPLFASLTLLLGMLFFVFYFWAAKLPTQPYYWLPILCLAAVCLDVAISGWLGGRYNWRLVYLPLMICVPLSGTVAWAKGRQTNIDLVSARVEQMAGPSDLVVVYPWYLGVSFRRYYKGAAPWTTIPEISDLRFHRYDLVKARMMEKAPLASVLERIGQTLRSGNRVWIVGLLPRARVGETGVPALPPAPGSVYGWNEQVYNYVWGRQTLDFIARAAAKWDVVPIDSKDPINNFENVALQVVR